MTAAEVWQRFWDWTATRPSSAYVFRGQSKDRPIVPKIGRSVYQYSPALELRMFRKFKSAARAFLSFDPRDDWDWLALAQHHGAPTRLTDWSENPLVALYFAVSSSTGEIDAVVYALDLDRPDLDKLDPESPVEERANLAGYPIPSPFSLRKGVLVLDSSAITPRITAQRGVFTAHAKPEDPIDVDLQDRFIVPAALSREVFSQLMELGIDGLHIFPDLDGLCSSLEARYKNGVAFSALG